MMKPSGMTLPAGMVKESSPLLERRAGDHDIFADLDVVPDDGEDDGAVLGGVPLPISSGP